MASSPSRTQIDLPRTARAGDFERYEPFGDGRQVVVRRGERRKETLGVLQGSRSVVVAGRQYDLEIRQQILSPSFGTTLDERNRETLQPIHENLRLHDVTISIRRSPRDQGFTDDEVEHILGKIRPGAQHND